MSIKRFLFLSLLFVLLDFSLNQSVLIDLPDGTISGREDVTLAGTSYYIFEKIPFAAPPVGELRFKAPQPPPKWDDILDTKYLDVNCFQLLPYSELPTKSSEDCLYLNVYTPELPESLNESLPVMVFIYGGGFLSGSSALYPPDLFLDSRVILVTINYRLGVFGFLSTQDTVIPGNNGLKDQHLAIQWTHNNIHLFGGDPTKITIFGQSAGAASVAYQLLNPKLDGLIRGAIMQSGSSICQFAFQRNPRRIAFDTASVINSTFESSDDSEELLEFLQNVDAEDLNGAATQYLNQVSNPWDFNVLQGAYYGPVLERENLDAFITKNMFGLVQDGNFIKVPIIIGINSEEALNFSELEVLEMISQIWDENLNLIVPDDMQIIDAEKHTKMGRQIRDIYTNEGEFRNNIGAAVRFSSDTSLTRSIIKYAELVSKFTQTYFYQFSYHGQLGGFNTLYEGAERVAHSEEIPYFFCSGGGCNFEELPELDQVTSKRLVKLWTDFAKYQNPTFETSDLLQNITWPKVFVGDGDFLYLNINDTLKIRNHPKVETYPKWVELYNSLNFTDFDTY